jgi:hypothetical protein
MKQVQNHGRVRNSSGMARDEERNQIIMEKRMQRHKRRIKHGDCLVTM